LEVGLAESMMRDVGERRRSQRKASPSKVRFDDYRITKSCDTLPTMKSSDSDRDSPSAKSPSAPTVPGEVLNDMLDAVPFDGVVPAKSTNSSGRQVYAASSDQTPIPSQGGKHLAMGSIKSQWSTDARYTTEETDDLKDFTSTPRPPQRQPTNLDLFEQSLNSVATECELRSQTTDDLVCEAQPIGSDLGLRIIGLSPWCVGCQWTNRKSAIISKIYRRSMIALVCAATVLLLLNSTLYLVVRNLRGFHDKKVSWTVLPLSLSASLGVLTTCGKGGAAWGQLMKLFACHTANFGVQERWHALTTRDGNVVLALLTMHLVVLTFIHWYCHSGEASSDAANPLRVWHWLVFFAEVLIGIIHAAMQHSMSNTCRAVSVLIDNFGNGVVNEPDLSKAIYDWKWLQAVLRRCMAKIEWMLMVEISGALALLPAMTLDLLFSDDDPAFRILRALPALFIVAGVLRLCLVAASITEKCNRVPSLVNALSFGAGTERMQQHIVEYIVRSNAGFYVADVKLSAELILRFSYTFSMFAFGVWSTLLKM